MIVKCSVKHCSHNDHDHSLFTIPNNLEIRDQWLNFLIASGKEVHNNVKYRICEDHFVATDFKQCKGRKMLVNGAVPSVSMASVLQISTAHETNVNNNLTHQNQEQIQNNLETTSKETLTDGNPLIKALEGKLRTTAASVFCFY